MTLKRTVEIGVNKRNILTKEERKPFEPETSRSFYLVFEVVEYTPRLNEAIDYFFQNVLDPQDNLTLITPMKTYRLKSEYLSKVSREEVVNQMRGILRKDAWIASSEYRHLTNDLKMIIKSINIVLNNKEPGRNRIQMTGGSIGDVTFSSVDGEGEDFYLEELGRYQELMQRMEHIRNIDQERLLDFAKILKDQEGQKYVFLFYQREYIPELSNRDYNKLLGKNVPKITMKFVSQMGYYFRSFGMDIETIKKVYADSSISINFLFFTKPAEHITDVQMVEHSEDIFGIFREMAQATGGITSSSSNPKYLFERASDAVESYYLLYYSPKNYKVDGKFKKIKVNVKGQKYRISHRAGYIAD